MLSEMMSLNSTKVTILMVKIDVSVTTSTLRKMFVNLSMNLQSDTTSIRRQKMMKKKKKEKKFRGQCIGADIRRGAGDLYEGQVFISGIAFKEVVVDYALKTGRNIKQNRYDKTNVGTEIRTVDFRLN